MRIRSKRRLAPIAIGLPEIPPRIAPDSRRVAAATSKDVRRGADLQNVHKRINGNALQRKTPERPWWGFCWATAPLERGIRAQSGRFWLSRRVCLQILTPAGFHPAIEPRGKACMAPGRGSNEVVRLDVGGYPIADACRRGGDVCFANGAGRVCNLLRSSFGGFPHVIRSRRSRTSH